MYHVSALLTLLLLRVLCSASYWLALLMHCCTSDIAFCLSYQFRFWTFVELLQSGKTIRCTEWQYSKQHGRSTAFVKAFITSLCLVSIIALFLSYKFILF